MIARNMSWKQEVIKYAVSMPGSGVWRGKDSKYSWRHRVEPEQQITRLEFGALSLGQRETGKGLGSWRVVWLDLFFRERVLAESSQIHCMRFWASFL